ncbi:MAG: NUDIX domain-containing protein [Ruminococcus sp.]|nr:NUDIX domain-containing protein [Ruminococcus sp.]
MIQGYNCIAVIHKNKTEWLMCKRKKDPYKGKLNLVGGKIEKNEDHLDAAYRELCEETGIGRSDITLKRFLTFDYPLDNCYVEVYGGELDREIEVKGDENTLVWVRMDTDFFDLDTCAGEGNIGHMLEIMKLHFNIGV